MQEKESQYNGITMSEFISAVRTVSSFISGVSSAPPSINLNADFLMTGFMVIPILESHNAFVERLKSLKDNLEAQCGDGSKTEATTESAHIMNNNN